MSVERAAYGMFTIVNNNMVNGIRRVSVERGYDPRDFVLVGAGGATAAHITALAARDGHRHDHPAEAGLRSLRLRPDHLGRQVQLHGDRPVRLDNEAAYARIDKLFERSRRRASSICSRDGFEKVDRSTIKRSLDMRYVGQVHECTVEIGNFDDQRETHRAR